MCDKMFSKRSAFSYLEDLALEFHKNYGRKVNTVTRPYAFIEFDVYIQKTKKNLTDRRRNINSINSQLQDVQRIMVNFTHNFTHIFSNALHHINAYEMIVLFCRRSKTSMMFCKEELFYLNLIQRHKTYQCYRKNTRKMQHI